MSHQQPQYGYGYGYAPQMTGYGYGAPAVSQPGSYTTPSVGYTPYQTQQQPKPPAPQPAVQAAPQSSVSAYLQQSYQQSRTASGYYGYQQPGYTPQSNNAQPSSYQPAAQRPIYTASQTTQVSYPTYQQSVPSYTPASTTPSQYPFTNSATTSSPVVTPVSTVADKLTPQQRNVITQYVASNMQSNGKTGWWNRKQAGVTSTKEYFCDVCKISAASEGAYKAHIEGKNHKKRLNQQKLQSNVNNKFKEFYCELCDVVCSNKDALEAHYKGAKHQKCLNLHRRLGKPVPTLKVGVDEDGKKVLSGPHNIVFVGGQTLQSTIKPFDDAPKEHVKVYPPTAVLPTAPKPEPPPAAAAAPQEDNTEETGSEPEPVGEHLVVAVTGDNKIYKGCYKCEMCDCYFNDDIAKKAHIKGRRHRTNYKKLYQPDLYIEPTSAQKKEKEKRQQRFKEAQERRQQRWASRQKSPETMEWDGGWDHTMSPDPYHDPHDDILVMDRHKLIYPPADEMKAVNKVVAGIEGALKEISDELKKEKAAATNGNLADEAFRDLKGVMRVGSYAKHLLLKDECEAELVLMCEHKPTLTLFNLVMSRLAMKFESMQPEGDIVYNATSWPDKSSITVVSQVESHRVVVTLSFTSSNITDYPTAVEMQAELGEGVLTRQYCVAALAALRHTKWFKAASRDTPTSCIVVRVVRDLCRRVPAWGVLDKWMVEVLVQQCASSAHPDFQQPGDIFKRVLECVASGIFIPGGKGLVDPCEGDTRDISLSLTANDRSRITRSAQHALRLMAFRKLHLVLGVDPLVTGGRKRGPPKPGGYPETKKVKTEN